MIVDYDDSSSDGSESQDSELERQTKSSSMAVSGDNNNPEKSKSLKLEALAKQKMLKKRNPLHKSETNFLDAGFSSTGSNQDATLLEFGSTFNKNKKIKTDFDRKCISQIDRTERVNSGFQMVPNNFIPSQLATKRSNVPVEL